MDASGAAPRARARTSARPTARSMAGSGATLSKRRAATDVSSRRRQAGTWRGVTRNRDCSRAGGVDQVAGITLGPLGEGAALPLSDAPPAILVGVPTPSICASACHASCSHDICDAHRPSPRTSASQQLKIWPGDGLDCIHLSATKPPMPPRAAAVRSLATQPARVRSAHPP